MTVAMVFTVLFSVYALCVAGLGLWLSALKPEFSDIDISKIDRHAPRGNGNGAER